jgi:6-phosphogluconolactonase/Glucosamine-6-phosphate isomerase/deaminase
MKITVMENEKKFDEAAAWRIIGQMLKKPNSVIGFSTGQTTGNMHAIVSEIYRMHPFDTSKVTVFNVDELAGLPRSYEGSCYAMIKRQICIPLEIPEERFIMPRTMDIDYGKECIWFEEELRKRGGADLQMLGIGWNGHIGINQPGTPFGSDTQLCRMDERFEAKVRSEVEVPESCELGGLTLGIKTIMHTKKIVLIAKGKEKAQIIQKALQGPVTEEIPASVLQLHPDCEVLLDADAASLL